jgi:hypothetical protein
LRFPELPNPQTDYIKELLGLAVPSSQAANPDEIVLDEPKAEERNPDEIVLEYDEEPEKKKKKKPDHGNPEEITLEL